MKRDLARVLLTQFLTALADNALLFVAVTLSLRQGAPGWYIPALQGMFLLAYVFGAPWAGRLADAWPKRRVLWSTNLVKLLGVVGLLLGLDPLLAYAVVGAGAAFYSPAKYGILPELAQDRALLQANGRIEGATILAILGGSWVGAVLAQRSALWALLLVLGCYLASALVALGLRHRQVAGASRTGAITPFVERARQLLASPRARFATLGVSLFWGAATVLRLLLVAWAPCVLGIDDGPGIAGLSLIVAAGIAVGALLAPRLFPVPYLRRTRVAAYVMGILIVLLAGPQTPIMARILLFLAGLAGGLFVVPVNACLQEIGHAAGSSGGVVAIQNFFENLIMLAASGFYALAAGQGADPVFTMGALGMLVLVATAAVAWHLPRDRSVRMGGEI